MKLLAIACLATVAVMAGVAAADQVIFKNGDRLTGKIESLDGGKLKVTSAVAGEIIVDMKDVATFSTDVPVEIRTAGGGKIHQQIAAGDADQVKTADGQSIALAELTKINPPPQVWSGAVVVSGAIKRGNTNTDDVSVNVFAALRRHDETLNDRISVGGGYFFGRQEGAEGDKITTTDNWNAAGKYDRFLSEKMYTYALFKVEHDRIADLNYRLSPGVGLGYQWIEKPDMNFSTEAGLTYVYDDYISGGSEENVAGRLGYHFDKKLNDVVLLFHNLDWVPAFEDPGDYNLLTDAGVRAELTADFFAEFRVEWKRDSTPAPGADKNDLRYLLGVGWMF